MTMKRALTKLMQAVVLAAVGMFLGASAEAASRAVSVPGYQANPGAIIEVPVSLDDAAGLAGIRAQINFDQSVLELLSVEAGPLGEAFEFSHGIGDGFVQLVFARPDVHPGGGGRLAMLRFRVNSGAPQGSYSELAVADINLSDSTGVVDILQQDTLLIASGLVTVNFDTNIDNEHNGLPDWWERQHGLSLFKANANADPDNDGLTGDLEYAFGGNPLVPDNQQRGVQVDSTVVSDQTFLALEFYRRTTDASMTVQLQESQDLVHWSDLNLPQLMLDTPHSMGDGTEFVRARGTIPMSGADARPRGFLRINVQRP